MTETAADQTTPLLPSPIPTDVYALAELQKSVMIAAPELLRDKEGRSLYDALIEQEGYERGGVLWGAACDAADSVAECTAALAELKASLFKAISGVTNAAAALDTLRDGPGSAVDYDCQDAERLAAFLSDADRMLRAAELLNNTLAGSE